MNQPQKDSEVLAEAALVIESGFTKELYARTPDGKPASPNDPTANCFCMVGAVCRVIGSEYISVGDGIVHKWVVPLIPKQVRHGQVFPGSARAWNDDTHRTQSEVAAKLREAAAAAAKAGS